MNRFIPVIAALALTASVMAHAGNSCSSPMAEWQPREVVTTYVAGLGISPEPVRVDDGCYEVRGLDADGNQVELEIEPSTLAVQKLKIRFQQDVNPACYLPGVPATGTL